MTHFRAWVKYLPGVTSDTAVSASQRRYLSRLVTSTHSCFTAGLLKARSTPIHPTIRNSAVRSRTNHRRAASSQLFCLANFTNPQFVAMRKVHLREETYVLPKIVSDCCNFSSAYKSIRCERSALQPGLQLLFGRVRTSDAGCQLHADSAGADIVLSDGTRYDVPARTAKSSSSILSNSHGNSNRNCDGTRHSTGLT